VNGREIVIRRPTGTVVRRIAIPAVTVAWAPDGRRLAFTRALDTKPPEAVRFAIYVMRLGGSPRRLDAAGNVDPFGLSWSVDGLVAWEKRGARPRVYVSRPAGRNPRRLVRSQGPPRLPSWSYDGETLAYSCDAALCAIRRDGTGRRIVARRCDMESEPGGMAWSPDGRHVVCTGRAFADLIDVRLATGEREVVRRRPPSGDFVPADPTWRAR
jgi:WD40-like Beta Propeller Repeat